MENENKTFDFLDTESSQRYFADADFALKSGRHIQYYNSDTKIWEFISDYFEPLQNYYEWLFGIYLKDDYNDNDRYFYLDFPDEGKGKLGKDRSKQLDDSQVIFGILLLNFYKEKYFEKKEIKWEELEQLFDESEQKEYWQLLFYGKKEATPKEIEKRKSDVVRIINQFDDLGWIAWIDKNEFVFEILPSINRIGKLYFNEIQNIEMIKEYLNA